ncbi:hypothetical protein ACSBR1_000156 [Camellia fascicularis]
MHFYISRFQSKLKLKFRIPQIRDPSKFSKNPFLRRTKSNTNLAFGELSEKLPTKIQKSASAKSTFAHFEEDKIVEACRLAKIKEGRVLTKVVEDKHLDAKADNFINRFKQQ